MYRRLHIRKTAAVFLILALVLSGCAGKTAAESAPAGTDTAAEEAENSESGSQNASGLSEMFTDRDFQTDYDENSSIEILLEGDSAVSDSKSVQISDGMVQITEEGTYILSGTLDNGMILVEGDDTEKIQLVLKGVSISNETSAAIYVREADKVFLTLADGTENLLSNGGTYEAIDDNHIDAVIFSKADLTLNGTGSLTIDAEAGHGIVSKDDLAITGGVYDIAAAGHGLSGKDSVRIAEGSFVIQSGKDGIHAQNDDDTSLGFLYIAEGTYTVSAQWDCLSAGNDLQIEGGTYDLTAGGGSENASGQTEDFGGMASAEEEDGASMKGIKADGNLTLNGGTFTVNAADDAIHSNADITVSGGEFQMTSGDDGIHADSAVVIEAGTISISESYEGIEGLTVDIKGGTIDLTASDDGINAAGGNDQSGFAGPGRNFGSPDSFGSDSEAYVCISGGTVHVRASGDGIDSNGSLTVSGGETYVSGPENSGNSSLDYGTEAVISGGIFAAAGPSQMAMNFGTSSVQGAMLVTVSSQQAGSTVTLLDDSGEELFTWTPESAYDAVLISCPELAEGRTYTLRTGTEETEVVMDSLIYGTSGDMGQMPGDIPDSGSGSGGMRGESGGGRQQPGSRMEEMPESGAENTTGGGAGGQTPGDPI